MSPLGSSTPPILVVHPEPPTPPTPDPLHGHPLFMTAVGIVTTFVVIFALRVAREFVLPVVMAVLLSLLLSPVVRWLRRRHVPEHLGAALVVFGTMALVVGGGIALAGPATDWLSEAPASVARAETKVRHLLQPLMVLQRTAERVQDVATSPTTHESTQVTLAPPGFLARWSGGTISALLSGFSIVFLTYFLLASGPLLRRKVADVLPSRLDRARLATLLDDIELVTSRYLLTSMMINTGVALATTLGLWLVGMPHPMLWGAMAGLFNFVPYLGAITTTTILAIASLSLSTPEAGSVQFAPLVFIGIHLIEGNLITPTILGRRLPVSSVAIFFGLLFWGWVWGIPGAILAVPLTVVVKVACDHLPGLHRMSQLLDN